MKTAEFNFDLPPELIAQAPTPQRDQSRMLVLHRDSGQVEHRRFRDLPQYLHPGDVLVLNNSRVIPARLRGANARTGGQFEVLLLEENAVNDWWVMLRPGKRARIGTQIDFRDFQGNPGQVHATVLEINPEGHRRLQFHCPAPAAVSFPSVHPPPTSLNILELLDRLGEVPLPPYISRSDVSLMEKDRHRYQTVFAKPPGSVAAPTAGLHFTEPLLDEIRARGIQVCFVTLHVGLGTFAPVKTETLAAHAMHAERFEVSEETARIINEARRAGRRIIAIGTTTVRVLESASGRSRREEAASAPRKTSSQNFENQNSKSKDDASPLAPGRGKTQIFIHPPYDFKSVDALLTNFHLPRSTLLMLVSAFAAPNETHGRQMVLSAYAEAIRQRYRFFSYGDAMFVL